LVVGADLVVVRQLARRRSPSLVIIAGMALVPLRCLSGARADAVSTGVSDRLGEFGERYGDWQSAVAIGAEFVVAAAEILHEGDTRDDNLRGAVGA
jgi:hypothetical protein